jgi:hypothetical protein
LKYWIYISKFSHCGLLVFNPKLDRWKKAVKGSKNNFYDSYLYQLWTECHRFVTDIVIHYSWPGASITKLTSAFDLSFGNFPLWNAFNFVQRIVNEAPVSKFILSFVYPFVSVDIIVENGTIHFYFMHKFLKA